METFGFKITILNLGDGFDYIDQENEEYEWIKFKEDIGSLNNELSEYFPTQRGIDLIAQPCRYFTQKSELFALKVVIIFSSIFIISLGDGKTFTNGTTSGSGYGGTKAG